MGFFDEAVRNFKTSVADVVAAPAPALSNFLDKNPAMGVLDPTGWIGSQAVKQTTGLSYSEQLAIGAAGGATAGAFGYTGLSQQSSMLAAQEAGMAPWFETFGLGPEGLGFFTATGAMTLPAWLGGAGELVTGAAAASEAAEKYAPRSGGVGSKVGAAIGGKVGGGIPPVVVGLGMLIGLILMWRSFK